MVIFIERCFPIRAIVIESRKSASITILIHRAETARLACHTITHFSVCAMHDYTKSLRFLFINVVDMLWSVTRASNL